MHMYIHNLTTYIRFYQRGLTLISVRPTLHLFLALRISWN